MVEGLGFDVGDVVVFVGAGEVVVAASFSYGVAKGSEAQTNGFK